MTTSDVLSILKKDAPSYAWPIYDLTHWPDRCRLFTTGESGSGFAFLHISGHPACRDCPAIILGGNPEKASTLLKHLPEAPYVIRETPATFQPLLAQALPKATIYPEFRMQADRASFKPQHKGTARKLSGDDAAAVAEFYGNPKAAIGMTMWLTNAFVVGAFAGGKLVALASTIVQLPDAWVLVSIETQREHRRKGYGAEVTSALTAAGLEKAAVVSLTVHRDNVAALGLYAKLGYEQAEERLWVDNGANFGPTP